MSSVQNNQNLPFQCKLHANSQDERLQKNFKEIEETQNQVRNMLGQLSNNEQKIISTGDRQQPGKIQRPVSFSCSQFILSNGPNNTLREQNCSGSQEKDPVLQQLQSLLKNKQGSNSKLCATFAVMNQPEPLSLFQTIPEHNLLSYFRQLQGSYHIEQSKKETQQNMMSEKDKLNMSYHSSYLGMREDITTYKVQYGQNSRDKNNNVLEQVKQLPMNGCVKQSQTSIGQNRNRKSNIKEQHEQISSTNQTENADETNNYQQSAYEYRGKSMEAEGLLKVNDEKYHPVNFKISEKLFSIADVPIQMEQIVKIKIFPANVEIAKHSILKITTKRLSEELLIGLRKSTKYATFPLPYYTFSKIIIKKLKSLRVSNVTNWIAPMHPPSQFFIKKKQRLNQHLEQSRSKSKQKSSMRGLGKSPTKMIKTQKAFQGTTNGGSQYKNVGSQIAYSLFSWQSELTVGKARTLIHGRIYKKSKHLGKWQKRYIVINQLGIFSFHSHTDKYPSVKIERAKIKYLWTWFSLVAEFKGPKQKSKSIFPTKTILDCEQSDQNMKAVEFNEKQIDKDIQVRQILSKNSKYLVVKLKHGFSQQTQFGIPICNFDAEPINKNWLYCFYKILPQTAPLLQKK